MMLVLGLSSNFLSDDGTNDPFMLDQNAHVEMSSDKTKENVVGKASYNVENCREAGEVADDDKDSLTQPNDLDECKPVVK